MHVRKASLLLPASVIVLLFLAAVQDASCRKLDAAPAGDLHTIQSLDKRKDYEAVRKALEHIMDDPGYDDGSYAPILIRLAWHASGTYDKATNTGGSNGATMRFSPECGYQANKGLDTARDLLEPVKQQFPKISYADLWTLAGAVAVERMGGPIIPWRPGRTDAGDGTSCPVDGRLPNAGLGAAHIRNIFGRMGFDDAEMVALIGAHAVGRCHANRSGYINPWTKTPTKFGNQYFEDLLEKEWRMKEWEGPEQYEDPSGKYMMLPTDMALVEDPDFKRLVKKYGRDEGAFFTAFAAAFSKLLELGVDFPENEKFEI